MKALSILLLLLAQGDRVRELIEQLRSDDADRRNQATISLKKLGREAVPKLLAAAQDPDLEVAARARSVLNTIAFLGRLPPRFAAAFPGVEDRLAAGEERVAAELLSEAVQKLRDGDGPLRLADIQWIAPSAVRGAGSLEQILQVLSMVREFKLTACVFELLDLLDHPTTEVRFLAMETITGLGGERPEAAFYGETGLADDQVVRVSLALIADVSPDLAEGALVRGLESPKTLRRRIAIRGLGRKGLKSALPKILSFASDASDPVRADVLLAVGELGGREGAALVLKSLGDSSLRVRTAAVVAAGKLKDERAVPLLLPLLSDPNSELQCAACRALGALRAMDALPVLLRLFVDASGSARVTAGEALRNFDGAQVAPELIRVSAGKPLDVRIRIVELLGEFDTAAAAPALSGLLSRSEPDDLRVEVLRTLLRRGAADCKPTLVPLLDDPGPRVRSFAARVLAELGSDDVAPRLADALAAEDPNAKYNAIMGLMALNVRSSSAKIAPIALDARNPDWVRLAALKAVEKLGGAEEIRTLKPLLADSLYELRSTSAKVLCWLGDPDAIGVVFEETRNWICLNALRRPEEWARLTSLPVGDDLRGTRQDVLEALAKKAGKTLEWSQAWENRGGDLAVPSVVLGRRKSVAEALRDQMPTGVEFVVETDRIRVLSRESSSEFWKAWREERQR
ncbi:MAG TPA: HEAT repeat domain-containing protein [Planctomycetota bacterium]|nr:HEAT repeat domain-containing protein [Planctomycetota bacterium]